MKQSPIPTAPMSPLVLSQTAQPVAVAKPFIHYEYVILKRTSFFCYTELFMLTKKNDNKWKLSFYSPTISYDIPSNKTNEDITMIINSLGVKKNNIYRVDVFNRDNLIQNKHFISLDSIIEFITKNEVVIEGVVYSR